MYNARGIVVGLDGLRDSVCSHNPDGNTYSGIYRKSSQIPPDPYFRDIRENRDLGGF